MKSTYNGAWYIIGMVSVSATIIFQHVSSCLQQLYFKVHRCNIISSLKPFHISNWVQLLESVLLSYMIIPLFWHFFASFL